MFYLKGNNIIRFYAIILFLSVALFPLSIAAQVHTNGYVDPYKADIDTGKTSKFVYPPLTEREGKGLDIPVPPKEHPRLFFRERDIPALKARMSNPLMNGAWDAIVENASLKMNGKLPQENVRTNMNMKVINAI